MAKRKNCKWRWGRNGGYYAYADGTTQWVNGLSAAEKRAHERMHGGCIFYTQDDDAFERFERRHFPWRFKEPEQVNFPEPVAAQGTEVK